MPDRSRSVVSDSTALIALALIAQTVGRLQDRIKLVQVHPPHRCSFINVRQKILGVDINHLAYSELKGRLIGGRQVGNGSSGQIQRLIEFEQPRWGQAQLRRWPKLHAEPDATTVLDVILAEVHLRWALFSARLILQPNRRKRGENRQAGLVVVPKADHRIKLNCLLTYYYVDTVPF